MTVTRTFLGWDQPPLEEACRWLLDQASDGDLSGLSVVTPGARVGRALLGLLVDRAAERGVGLSPPSFFTTGEIAGAVLRPRGKVAGPVQARIAWCRAIETCEELDGLIPHRGGLDGPGRQALASVLAACHDELIGEGLRFGDVPGRVRDMEDREAHRWRAADAAQRVYEFELASVGLLDDGLARVQALNSAPGARPLRVVLVGVPDLNHVARRALGRPEARAEALVFAPPELAALFDEFGSPRTDQWANRRVPIPDSSIAFADGPEDQAHAVVEFLARLGGACTAHDITVGVPDESVIPHIVRAAERYAGVRARAASGTEITQCTVYRLLACIARVLEEDTFDAAAALIRQPDMERHLLRRLGGDVVAGWLSRMDTYACRHLPRAGLDAQLPGDAGSDRTEAARVREVIRELLAPLRASSVAPADLLAVLQRTYSKSHAGRGDPAGRDLIRATEVLHGAIAQVAALPRSWHPRTGAELVHLVLQVCKGERLPAPSVTGALELLGWLELPLDTAPVAIVTGLNDGRLPESFGADPLLPDSLREKLGLACSARRLARDAYLLTLLHRSRRELRLICGRRGPDGDPLLPSRLLFAAETETVVRRVREFCREDGTARPRLTPLRTPGVNRFIDLPGRGIGPIVESMPVTSFRTFMASPYLFFLRHALRLEECGRPEPELDPLNFGTFIHEVLKAFAQSDAKDSTSRARVHECLMDLLGDRAASRFGKDPAISVRLQIELARLRLAEFAVAQAQRRQQGWRIAASEWQPGAQTAELPGAAIPIRGTIDRIDVNDEGELAILDYKTGDTVKGPKEQHKSRGRWTDLQLPLYRHLAKELGLPDPARVKLGYIAVPGRPSEESAFRIADWSPQELRDADDTARRIVDRVVSGDFFHLGDNPAEAGAFGALSGTALASGAPRGLADE